MSSCGIETQAASHTQTDRSTYLKEDEISNYRSGSQGDRRDRLPLKCVAKETRQGLSSFSALHDKLSGCSREEQSILLRGMHLFVWLLCILFQLHSECQAPPNRTGCRSSWRQEQTPSWKQRQVVSVAWPALRVPRHALCCPPAAAGRPTGGLG